MEGTEPLSLEIDPDFEPQPRARSCTWPLPRPDLPVVQPQASAEENHTEGTNVPRLLPPENEDRTVVEGLTGAGVTPRKGGSRRNAWGNQSYAELISQAIESSPEKRLTLSQIYDWMVKSIPFFKDKGDSNSSAGWKNSIRHNLSLHSKFIKVHNEATGKSSWWMLNPEGGKSGKAPRRRAASMDNSSSSKLIKVRNKVSKKKPSGSGEPPVGSPISQTPKWPGSPSSRSSEDNDVWNSFRPRTGSNASSARLSPILLEQEDLADDDHHSSVVFSGNVPPTVTEELDLIDGITMLSSGSSMLPSAQTLLQGTSTFSLRSTQSAHYSNSLFSPVEHSTARASSTQFSRPPTLEALLTSDSPPPSNVLMTQMDPILTQGGGQNPFLLSDQSKSRTTEQTTLPINTFMPHASLSMLSLPQTSSLPCSKPASFVGTSEHLPIDLDMDMILENLECDMDSIITHELMDGGGLDFNFEFSIPGTNPGNNHSWVPS
ncbi:forkhead box protein O4 [Bombina bombina]|uniref:forkhead box protein O4 n=1 Tax=Bombina bombina TaxID=8345 RepID=UPI00235B2C73|nr:forkhead box protein O4 [Bombina bombina]